MSAPEPDMRALVAELDREERAYRAADSANRTIRMGRGRYGVSVQVGDEHVPAPVPKGRWLKIWSGAPDVGKLEHRLTEDEITEVADALWQAAIKHQRRAWELAKQLNTRARI